ncbi:DUF3857 domain-containing protein [Candidatus Protochlamydia phocaeensis]|uniref:DUF3857 domain-containing protein n=1 Tax=Candidatus Protochlamydia phocaeensis TaxID=1414722 RepID=UPI000839A250|nr:DUF3857 domain-containing protein [Candidatus Protochlamydia phocaeensis]
MINASFSVKPLDAVSVDQILIASLPDWIVSSGQLERQELESDNQYLLVERQVHLEKEQIFDRFAYKLLNDEDVQQRSTLTISFDPSYETLTLHTLRVYREDKVINKLNKVKAKVIQREENSDAHLYDGCLTALFLLDDIREGDIVEYAYSLQGFNPVLKPDFGYSTYLQFSEPLDKYILRLFAPKHHQLFIKNHFTAVEPVIDDSHPDQCVYCWELSHLPRKDSESAQPEWFDDFPFVQISSFPNWQAVVKWGESLFALPDDLTSHCSADMLELVAEWKDACPTKEGQALKAVRFVQDKIRYLGMENGISSFKPHDPVRVFENRFGDCKDKTQLLRTFFRLLDIDSYPVLVNTRWTKFLNDYHPTYNAFNHAIVQAVINDRVYWIDPTLNFQGGSLEANYYPSLHYGLVLKPDSDALASIPPPTMGQIKHEATFFLLVPEKGAAVEVVSTYTGHEADYVRRRFKKRGEQKIAQDYEKFYSSLLGKLKQTHPLEVKDDRETNQFVTKESYYVDAFLEEDENQQLKFSLFPLNLSTYLNQTIDPTRQTPLSHLFPLDISDSYHFVKINGGDWSLQELHDTLSDEAFSFQVLAHAVRDVLTFDFAYHSYDDHVKPENLAKHRELMQQAQENSYTVTLPADPLSEEWDWSSSFLPLIWVFLIGIAFFMRWGYKK